MPIIESAGGSYIASVDAKGAQLVNPQGFPISTGATFRVSSLTGATTGLGAGNVIWALRWGSSTYKCLIHSFWLDAITTTAFDAAQVVDYRLSLARSYTVAYGGGTSITPAATAAKLDPNQTLTSSVMSDLRIATTAAFSGGTITYENAMHSFMFYSSGAGANLPEKRIDFDADKGGPLVLNANQGLGLRVITAYGTTGTVKLQIGVQWSEIPV